MSRLIIYGLTEPNTDEIRYIGKSKNGLQRATAHGSRARLIKEPTHKSRWILSLLNQGTRYGVVVLETVCIAADLDAAEIRWIAYGRAAGWRLTNATTGGDGGLPGFKHGPAARAAIAKAQRGRKRPDLAARNTQQASTGRQHSDTTRDRMRVAATQRWNKQRAHIKINLLPADQRRDITALRQTMAAHTARRWAERRAEGKNTL